MTPFRPAGGRLTGLITLETRPIPSTLRRLAEPLRPIVHPIRWTVLPRLTRVVRKRLPPSTRLLVPPGSPIRPMTWNEYDELVMALPYYAGRWSYMSKALEESADLIRRHDLRTALELGAPVRPIIVGADVMDIVARPELDPSIRMTVHDATQAPWPFDDKAYDLFLALQVFEHLKDGQRQAFREVRRVARDAVLSLPIGWQMSDPRNVHHMIPEERVLGWFAPVVPTKVIQGNGGSRRRVIYVFEDLPPPGALPGE